MVPFRSVSRIVISLLSECEGNFHNSFDDMTLSLLYVITAVAWSYQLQLPFSAVCLGAPSSSQQQQGALGCSPGPDMCSPAHVWCYQQQLSSLLLVGCYQQQMVLCCCLGTTRNSSGPRGAPLGLVLFPTQLRSSFSLPVALLGEERALSIGIPTGNACRCYTYRLWSYLQACGL